MTPMSMGQGGSAGGIPGPANRFRPHGRTTMWADGAIVHVVAEGPFNVEAADVFSDEVVALYRQLPRGQRFVNLTEFRTSMMATPEAWERLGHHLSRIDGSGLPLVATAWIAGADVEGRALFMPKGVGLFAERGRRFEVFVQAGIAEDWARRQLAG